MSNGHNDYRNGTNHGNGYGQGKRHGSKHGSYSPWENQQAQPTPQLKACLACNFGADASASYCSKCGSAFAKPNEQTCSRCQTMLSSDSRFCSQCGQQINPA
ncbi:double zinc ribbon domain-containing protein [Brucella pituitosa]